MYKYPVRNKDEYVIFFWQGRNSSVNEKGTSAYLTVDLSDSISGVQVRVVQNKEPKQFLDIFGGKIIVHHSKRIHDHLSAALYQVCENDTGVHIVQVENDCLCLNSNHTFIVITPEQVILWYGSGSSEKEKQVSKSTVEHETIVGERSIVEIEEGSKRVGKGLIL